MSALRERVTTRLLLAGRSGPACRAAPEQPGITRRVTRQAPADRAEAGSCRGRRQQELTARSRRVHQAAARQQRLCPAAVRAAVRRAWPRKVRGGSPRPVRRKKYLSRTGEVRAAVRCPLRRPAPARIASSRLRPGHVIGFAGSPHPPPAQLGLAYRYTRRYQPARQPSDFPDIRTSRPSHTGDHRAMIQTIAARPSGPWSGNCGPTECSMTAETAPGQARGTPGGLAEPGPARPSFPDRMATYGIWLAVITHILLHDRRLQATVITGVIGTYALASAIKNNQARPVRRAVAWYNVQGEVHGMEVLHRGRRALKPGNARSGDDPGRLSRGWRRRWWPSWKGAAGSDGSSARVAAGLAVPCIGSGTDPSGRYWRYDDGS